MTVNLKIKDRSDIFELLDYEIDGYILDVDDYDSLHESILDIENNFYRLKYWRNINDGIQLEGAEITKVKPVEKTIIDWVDVDEAD